MASSHHTFQTHIVLLRFVAALAVAATLLFSSTQAYARHSVKQLSQQLRSAKDFRVRVQAALALGASRSPKAVAPLCRALRDKNRTVRGASAAALGRLRNKRGATCLESRLSHEKNIAVKRQIKRALKRIRAAGNSAATLSKTPTSQTRWYVTIGKTKFRGSVRNVSAFDAIVQEAIRKKLASHQQCAISPPGSSANQVRATLAGKHIAGYFLQPVVDAPKYRGGKLIVRVRLTMYSYPNKALKGEFSRNLKQSGTSSKDEASERELLKMASDHVAGSFLKVAETSRH